MGDPRSLLSYKATAPNSAIYCQKQPSFRMMRIPLGITSPSLCLYHLSLALPYNIRWSGRCWESFSKRQMRAGPRCSASACHLSNAPLKPRSKCNFALFPMILIWTNIHHSFIRFTPDRCFIGICFLTYMMPRFKNLT